MNARVLSYIYKCIKGDVVFLLLKYLESKTISALKHVLCSQKFIKKINKYCFPLILSIMTVI